MHHISGVQVVGPYSLEMQFADGVTRMIDFQPVLAGEVHGPLRDRCLFEQVKVDPEVHTLVWPNGADFEPATLHNWPAYKKAFQERAMQWAALHQ